MKKAVLKNFVIFQETPYKILRTPTKKNIYERLLPEAVAKTCSAKKVFLEILQNRDSGTGVFL